MRTICTFLFISISLWVFPQNSFVQEGKASFYADKFEGRVTASGEKYSHQKATCAHISLPFGSLVRVTNLANNLSVVVRVNDRGPFVANRIIDLSLSAAEKLQFVGQGLADVRVELLEETADLILPQSPPTTTQKPNNKPAPSTETTAVKQPVKAPATSTTAPAGEAMPSGDELFKVEIDKIPAKGFTVQVGSYRELVNVLRIADDLKSSLKKDVMVQTSSLANGDKVYRLMVGHFGTRREADNFREKARKLYPDCFIVELK